MPRNPLLMIAMLMSRCSCTAVASSGIVIWNPPSPTTTQTSASGQAIFAPIAAGRDQRSRAIVLVVLRFPHLVLADVGDDERLAFGETPDVVDHVRGVEVA